MNKGNETKRGMIRSDARQLGVLLAAAGASAFLSNRAPLIPLLHPSSDLRYGCSPFNSEEPIMDMQFLTLCVLASGGALMIFMLYRAKREEEREARDAPDK